MMLFTRVYPSSETLGAVPQGDRYHRLLRGVNDLTSSMGRESVIDMSHQGLRLSVALTLSGSGTTVMGGYCLWCRVRNLLCRQGRDSIPNGMVALEGESSKGEGKSVVV